MNVGEEHEVACLNERADISGVLVGKHVDDELVFKGVRVGQ